MIDLWRAYELSRGIDSWDTGVGGWSGVSAGFCCGGLWLVQRSIHERINVGETLIDNGVVGWFFSGVLTIYGITLGLIAVTTWESSSEVEGIASREAATIAALYRDAGGLPVSAARRVTREAP